MHPHTTRLRQTVNLPGWKTGWKTFAKTRKSMSQWRCLLTNVWSIAPSSFCFPLSMKVSAMFSKPILSRGQSLGPATIHPTSRTGYGLQKHSYRRQISSGCRSQVRKDNNESSISWHPRNTRGQSSNSQNIPLPELWYRVYASGFIQRTWCQNGKLWQQRPTSNLFVVFPFFFSSPHLTRPFILFRLPS